MWWHAVSHTVHRSGILTKHIVQNCRVPAACLNVKPRHIVKHALVGLLRRQARSNGDYYDDKPVPMGSLRALPVRSRLTLDPFATYSARNAVSLVATGPWTVLQKVAAITSLTFCC